MYSDNPFINVMVKFCFYMVLISILVVGFRYIHDNASLLGLGEPERDISGYTIYLDGVEVDSDKIDISLYKCSYDDENKIVYMTDKDETRTNIPIYVPVPHPVN